LECKINIRHGIINDAESLSRIGAQTFYKTFSKDNSEENIRLLLEKTYSSEIQAKELADPDILYLIVEIDLEMVGFAKLHLNNRDISLQGRRTLEIERIYAVKECIGKGAGRELMQGCIQEALQRGCDSVWLGVWEKNSRAISFYKKMGFQEVGEHTFTFGYDPQRDIIMELRIEKS